ncbi:MAG: molybdopterin molybdotransferase MoeA [Methyloglobulus sp.]|nr:molybdopterin molybdotransferase MoeA [Methyloglobulus sp.]
MIDPCSLEAKPLLSLDDALTGIRTAIKAVAGEERVALKKALGRVLSEAVYSPINLPTSRNSAMDGYALSSIDINPKQPFVLRASGISWAGKPFQGELQAGQCIRIFTGALLSAPTDTVVIQEQVKVDGDHIVFPATVVAGENVREAGEDIAKCGLLIKQHKKLTAADLGLLASAGIVDVLVKPKINIAFFSTGDELIGGGQPLEPGKIYDSNRYMLAGLLADPCYNAVDMGVIADDRQLLEDTIKQAAKHNDVIITTGGASVGDADYIKDILAQCGEVKFWKIAIKPGKPLAFGNIGPCYFFGLPGNPVSAMVTFQQIVAPALIQLSGAAANKPLRLMATCTTALKKSRGRQDFQRGILTQDTDGNFFVESTGHQGSHILSSMSRSNCYIILPAEANGVSAGDKVWVEPFSVFI